MIPLQDNIRSRSFPLVNWLLIAANVTVFILETRMGNSQLQRFTTDHGMVPTRFLSQLGLQQAATIYTSMFLHGGWLHVISNMWALFLFGDNVEDRMGHFRYLVFYLVAGTAAALTHIYFNSASALPTIGASGAIAGVLGAYLVLFPRARVTTLFLLFFLPWFIEIPAILYLGFWFVSQLFSGVFSLAASSAASAGGVAYWAHAGGFITGLILVKFFEQRRTYHRWHSDEYWPW